MRLFHCDGFCEQHYGLSTDLVETANIEPPVQIVTDRLSNSFGFLNREMKGLRTVHRGHLIYRLLYGNWRPKLTHSHANWLTSDRHTQSLSDSAFYRCFVT